MAVEPLSGDLKLGGKAMLEELDAIGLAPQGVLWLHFHALNDWRLTIISDLIDVIGRTKVYGLIDQALEKHGPVEGLTIFDVHLASPGEVLPRVLGGAFQFEGGEATLANCNINGMPVDAHVYRLVKPRAQPDATRAARIFERRVKQLSLQH